MRPSIMPRIFNVMSGLLQKGVQGQNPKDVHPDLPSGRFLREEGLLKSKPFPSGKSYISGRFDLLAHFDDGTYGVIDVKMIDAKDGSLGKFDRQLHAYKYAFEHSQNDQPIPISKIGLLIVTPTDIRPHNGYLYYKAKPVWKEIPINMDKFFGFVQEVENVLDGPLPSPSNACGWCKYKNGITTPVEVLLDDMSLKPALLHAS